ncbi:hypothetical protein E8E14_003159 [Neopestalotiopsis sp. 37M]|nr:hypothetical protein E8E14_003159 [Neopestalotiopsis sp. 37M]
MSPRWNAGAMDSETTQTMGTVELVRTESPFHAMKAVLNGKRKEINAEKNDNSFLLGPCGIFFELVVVIRSMCVFGKSEREVPQMQSL